MILMASGVRSMGRKWNWMFSRVVAWPFLRGAISLAQHAQSVQLVGVQPSNGNLHAEHLGVGLTLAVDALLEAEGHERVGVPLPP